jgi:hypothetical protein
MKIAYIVHAYKLPKQLSRMINSLSDNNSSFFVHIDKKVDIEPFKEEISKINSQNIFFY